MAAEAEAAREARAKVSAQAAKEAEDKVSSQTARELDPGKYLGC
jgi:hypothetical protein